VTRRRRFILAIGLVVAAPLIFAAAGATQRAGLVVGVVLVVVGIGMGLVGAGRARDGDRDGRRPGG
jgi:hypothetical protein